MIKEAATRYFNAGLSVIPVGKDKLPHANGKDALYRWKKHQSELIEPNGMFDGAYGLAIVCGKSFQVECIDIDCKYDLTGTLLKDYCELIKSQDENLIKKLVIEKSVSGGYHFIYKTKKIDGNKKLAERPASGKELEANKDETTKVLIETRGEGGYFVCAPTSGYKVMRGNIELLNEITEAERDLLIDSARVFNQVIQKKKEPKVETGTTFTGLSPFDDWNLRGDVLPLLEQHGWKITYQRGSKNLLLRPGGEKKWSADYDSDRRTLYVFTKSTSFPVEEGISPTGVLAHLNFNDDYSATAKWLLQNGYGERTTSKKKERVVETVISEDENDLSFIATDEEVDNYITKIRNGTFQMGLPTGIPTLDEYFLLKPGNLVVVLGHDNVGKSVLIWYLATLSAIFHGWKWIIYSNENNTGTVKKKILEFYRNKQIKDFSETELSEASAWFKKHFTVIKNTELFTYLDMIRIGKKLCKKEHRDAFLIDPYNSLWAETNDRHEFDYKVMMELRQFKNQTGCGIYLNCHAVTEALRRRYAKESDYAGFPMPPEKADAEGGGKFANKADDFLVAHRLLQHPTEWMNTEIHVKKIKEMETGGKHTIYDQPVKLKIVRGGYGFEDMNGFNPVQNYWANGTYQPKIEFVNETALKDFTEPKKIIEDDPF